MSLDVRSARPVPDRVHLVGVGGVGMSGLARLLLHRGHSVSGSDLRENRLLDELRALGADVRIGHDPAVVADVDQVVISTAVPDDNPEVAAAREAGTEVAHRARALADLVARDHNVVVAGTHGKTTTTSMAVVGLQSCGLDPSFVIGGKLNEVGANAHGGADEVAVVESDESDRSFLVFEPDLAVVTNLELDHPDAYTDTAEVEAAFDRFLARRRGGGPVLLGVDDAGAAALAERADGPVVTYGEDPGADVHLEVTGPGTGRLRIDDETLPLRLSVPGRHNLRNAAGAVAAVWLLGSDPGVAAERMHAFVGAQRRFQRLGEAAGVAVVDDYAHHPTELAATIAAARGDEPERVVVVVQPHRFSRTAVLGEALGRAAAAADLTVVTDVYAGPEQPRPGVSGRLVADAAEAAGGQVRYEPHLGAVAGLLAEEVRDGDLVLVTGAGDVTKVGPDLLDRLRARRA